jgi:hypothetical protein
MNASRKILGLVLLIGMAAVVGEAQTRRVTEPNPQTVRTLLRRIDSHIDTLRNTIATRTNRTSDNTREDDANVLFTNLSDAVVRLRQQANQRRATAEDAQQVLDQASSLSGVVNRRRVAVETQQAWSNLRVDFNELARIYGLTWTETVRDNAGRRNLPYAIAGLTGTYRLDSSRTEDPGVAIDRALRSLPYQDRQKKKEQLLRRLDPPNQIAIDIRGRTVTLASTRAAQVSFEADGREQTETTNNGRTMRLRSELTGNQLTVTTTGDRNNEFTVTFNLSDSGRLAVTRRVYVEGLTNAVEIQSFYEKTSEVAQFDVYSAPQNDPRTENNDEFILRNGETVVAELTDALSTSTSKDGDTFTAAVRSPAQYAGATIDGHVSNIQRSGRVTGRSALTFSFDRIRLRDGRSYRFAGILESVRLPNGETARIDNEGAIQEDSHWHGRGCDNRRNCRWRKGSRNWRGHRRRGRRWVSLHPGSR